MDYLDDEVGDLVLPADALDPGRDLEERVQTTQNRLAELRQEAEALEEEKRRFEELSRQQKEFMQGRSEMGDKLTRALAHLDRETYEAQRRVEQLLVIKDTFTHHLDVVDSLNPEQWNPHDLRHDLGQALGMIEDAREEFIKGTNRIQQLTAGSGHAPNGAPAPSAVSASPAAAISANGSAAAISAAPAAGLLAAGLPVVMNRESFRFWLFCGLAFTVPLAATALVIFVMWLIAR